MKRLRRDEHGQALIVAVLIMLIVAMIGVVTIALAQHNSQQSARNRRRVQAIAAAEAGINYAYSFLQTATPTALELDAASAEPCTVDQLLDADIGARFTVSVSYFIRHADGTTTSIPCSNPQAVTPNQALITSVGQGLGTSPRRTMESLVRLNPIRGGLVSASALFSEQSINLASNLALYGGLALNADIYSGGTFQGSTNQLIQGSIFAQGDINLAGSGGIAELTRDAYARNNVTLSKGYPVRGNVIAAQGNISVGGRIDGDATAGGSITPSNPDVGGSVSPNKPGIPPPPVRTFPIRQYLPDEYTNAGYTNQRTYSGANACTDAVGYLTGTGSTEYGGQSAKTVIRVASSCVMDIRTRFGVRNDLAILADGAVDMRGGLELADPGQIYNVIIDSGLDDSLACVPGSSGPRDFVLRSNSNFSPGLRTVVRSGCNASFASNGSILDGQVLARGLITFSSNTSMTFYAVEVPGEAITGFNQELFYLREIPTA